MPENRRTSDGKSLFNPSPEIVQRVNIFIKLVIVADKINANTKVRRKDTKDTKVGSFSEYEDGKINAIRINGTERRRVGANL